MWKAHKRYLKRYKKRVFTWFWHKLYLCEFCRNIERRGSPDPLKHYSGQKNSKKSPKIFLSALLYEMFPLCTNNLHLKKISSESDFPIKNYWILTEKSQNFLLCVIYVWFFKLNFDVIFLLIYSYFSRTEKFQNLGKLLSKIIVITIIRNYE